ncbi:F-box only protein 27 [Chionoecetes opilio]|uniref:F-box only protein 27 n=1 Tax=Chionoecetes opilio TaxID=41210 RepID=A0A8J5CMS7_CHIOP|nr:F-box only protein 27 [Chionoecetes opilio]
MEEVGVRSKICPEATQDNRSFQEVPEGNGFIFFGQVLPIEMCEEILLNVPASDLIKSVTKVCQNWHHLLTTLNFWLRKVKRDGFHLSASIEKRLTEEDLCRALRVLQGISSRAWPLNSNLIHNPSGKDRLKHWIVQHGGNGLKVECPPSGSNAIPEKAGLPTQHCFVSSYTPCVRSQTIILKSHKIEPWIMDILRPEIHVSEWVCARWTVMQKVQQLWSSMEWRKGLLLFTK